MILLLCGAIAAIALVLPGISVSYMLLLMGLYDKTMRAITQIDIGFLLPLAFGGLTGILLVTKFLEFVMTKFPKETYLIILGFVIGSLLETFPGIPNGWDWILCIMTSLVGFTLIYRLSKLEN